jgi:hypothetical protein
VELFAWLSEMVIYRVNRIPDESYVNFLKLLAGAPENADLNRLLNIPFLFKWVSPDKPEAFRNFLKNELYIDWVENADIAQINDTILRASSGKNWADLILDENRDNAILKINGSRIQYLHVDELDGDLNICSVPDLDEKYRNLIKTLKEIQTKCLFNWDEIPGNDNGRLVEFLKLNFGIDWVKTAKIEKFDGDKTIKVSTEGKSVSLRLNDEKTKVNINIDDVRTDELIIKTENDRLDIYRAKQKKLPEIKEAAVGFMESQYRVITSNDFEDRTLNCMEKLQKGLKGRAICMNNRDLEYSKLDDEKPGHVSMIIIPNWVDSLYCKDKLNPNDLLLEEVKADLAARRLITTRVHVVAPFYHDVRLRILIALKENVNEIEVIKEAQEQLTKYFHPIAGGPEGKGWPIGRNVYRSELYHLLEKIERVDHVSRIWIDGDPERASVQIKEYQLIALDEIIVEKVAYE